MTVEVKLSPDALELVNNKPKVKPVVVHPEKETMQ